MKRKVHWTQREKRMLVDSAVRLQVNDPSLSGLALLRQAMKSLRPDRRRMLQSLAQAPWFDEMLALAVKAASAERAKDVVMVRTTNRPDDPYVPLLQENNEYTLKNAESMQAIREMHERWREELEGFTKHYAAILSEVLSELTRMRLLLEKLSKNLKDRDG